jgi:hypothetical protein
LKKTIQSPDVEYNVTSGRSLEDASIAEFCILKHPSVGKDLLGLWLQWFFSCKEYVVKVTSFEDRQSVVLMLVGWIQKVKEKGFYFQCFGFEVCAEKNNVKICGIKRNVRSNKEWRLLKLHIRT